ncbi:hypothetical protein L6164_002188 [Bauhinia variegata]|uniref:Uncharacterized protein n=1 Tax=Bauhinia variegata TaxID=167791 RepID=A0ACB9PZI6_BAUVA|nr:hypothetical protein L6164_002188 [Bauhinia variegata]
MHHLIQDMGRNIVKQESPLEPGGRSRLWLREDIIHVLEENTALKKFEQLKEIKLNCCKFLEQVPDLSEVPNLTELHLDFCENLIEIHDSVGFLDKLRVISAKSCVNLKNFPRFMKLKSLEILNLECCLSLKFFPEIVGKMGNLSHISLRKSAIEELPCSIENVTRILHLDLSYCHKLSKVPPRILMSPVLELLNVGESSRFGFMKKLGEQEQVTLYHKRVWLRGCNFLDGFLPTFLGLSPNITELEICRCNFTILPECIQVFKFLIHLNLDNCKQLQEIRGVPQNIKVFSARNCTSLMPSASNINIILDQSIHSRGNTKFILPGTWIPKWFDHFGKEACLSFWFRNELPEIAIFVIGGPNRNPQLLRFNCKVYVNGLLLMKRNHRDRSIVTPDIWNHDDGKLKTKHTYLRCKLNERPDEVYFPEDKWNHAKISFEIRELQHFSPRGRNLVQQTGIYIYNRARIERDILFTNPNLHLNPEPSKEQLKRKSQLLD